MLLTCYRYILKELFLPFFAGIVVSTFILIMFQILRLTEFIVVHGVSYEIIFKLLYYQVVMFLPITVPISFLFSVLLVFNRLSSDSEIIAFKASGISIYQLLIPVTFVSVFAALITFYISFKEGPWGNRNFENTVHRIITASASVQLKEGLFNDDFFNGFMLYADKITNDNRMKKIFIYDDRDPAMPVAVTAKTAKIDIDEETKKTVMYLYDGFMNFVNNPGSKYRRAKFDSYRVLLYEGDNITHRTPTPPSLTYEELNMHINNAIRENNDSWYNKMAVELQRRFAVPFSCIIFGFLGIGFGNTNRRNVKAGAGLLSFIVMILYWLIYVVGTSLGTSGTINPIVGVWMSNFIFVLISVYLIRSKA